MCKVRVIGSEPSNVPDRSFPPVSRFTDLWQSFGGGIAGE